MNISAIQHRSTLDMCYAADEDTAVIRLRTGKDITQAYIICADPFIHRLIEHESVGKEWFGVKYPMTLSLELPEHFLWEYRTKPPYKRLQYYFEVTDGTENRLVYYNTICPPDTTEKTTRLCYKLPWMNPSDVIKPPGWVRDTVWYQIFPDTFCRAGETYRQYAGREMAWGEVTQLWNKWGDFAFGDLKGVTSRLPYLRKLGINGIYFTPIFLCDSNHRYDTYDYNALDPILGTEEDMAELVRRAHEEGIRIMLDGVFNHCGPSFFAWMDVMQNGKASPYFDWFFINGDEARIDSPNTADGRYYSFAFVSVMPKLNTNNPEVIRYFCDVCSRWVRDWDIDGIRFDVGDEVSHTFLRELRRTLRSVKKDLFLLGENWFDSLPWLEGDEYDSTMNYPAYDCVNDFDRERHLSSVDFMRAYNTFLAMYPEQVTEVLFNFIDTHDTKRIAWECEGNHDLLLQKLAMLFTLPGTPCIFYGTEIALVGDSEWHNRVCMPWNDIDSGKYDDILGDVSGLIHLRREREELKGVRVAFLHDEKHPRMLHYLRSAGNELDGGNEKDGRKQIGVCLNCGGEAIPFQAGGTVLFSRLYDGKTLLPNGTVLYEV